MFGSDTEERVGRATAVFDIDSASVGVGIFVGTTATEELVWSCRVTYSVQQELEYVRFVRTMLSALLEAGMRLSTEGVPYMHSLNRAHVRHMDCVCVLSGPWFVGNVVTSTVWDEKMLTVTPALMKEHVQKLRQELLDSPQGERFQKEMRGAECIESNVLRVTLNGYQVDEWQGRKCVELSVCAWFAMASPDVHTQIQEIVDKVLPNAKVTYRSSTMALFDVVCARLPRAGRLTVVEVGGELTMVTSVEDGIMKETHSFPLGTHSILRTLIAEDEKEAHARGKLTLLKKKPPTVDDIPAALRTALQSWSASMVEAIETVYSGVTPPRNVVLVADQDLAPWYTKLLEEPVLQKGIRELLGFRTVPLVPTAATGEKAQPDDARLAVLGFGLSTARRFDA